MERFAWICFAGAAGSGTRYLIGLWAEQRFGTAFTYGTLIVNLAGCFAMGAVMHAALTLSWSVTTRSAITIGFLGGLKRSPSLLLGNDSRFTAVLKRIGTPAWVSLAP